MALSRMTHSLSHSLPAVGHSWHSSLPIGPNCLDAPLAAFACGHFHCHCRRPGGLIGGAQCTPPSQWGGENPQNGEQMRREDSWHSPGRFRWPGPGVGFLGESEEEPRKGSAADSAADAPLISISFLQP